MDRAWFHWHGGMFFRRGDEGTVEIGMGTGFDDVHVEHSIDSGSWASIVSSVSARGEDHTTFNEALNFHMQD